VPFFYGKKEEIKLTFISPIHYFSYKNSGFPVDIAAIKEMLVSITAACPFLPTTLNVRAWNNRLAVSGASERFNVGTGGS